jgi:Cys-tRNA(Pro)/Cys-tRNA(Cys) deacylase
LEAAAKTLGVRNVHLVPFNQAEEISGFPPGGTPSIYHKTKMRTIIDKSILKFETVYCGGGSRDELLELKTADIIQLSQAQIADIARNK